MRAIKCDLCEEFQKGDGHALTYEGASSSDQKEVVVCDFCNNEIRKTIEYMRTPRENRRLSFLARVSEVSVPARVVLDKLDSRSASLSLDLIVGKLVSVSFEKEGKR